MRRGHAVSRTWHGCMIRVRAGHGCHMLDCTGAHVRGVASHTAQLPHRRLSPYPNSLGPAGLPNVYVFVCIMESIYCSSKGI